MLDLNDLRFFLAVSRHGKLSIAARELNVSQPTVGRRLAALEASLGVRLLNRTPGGYVPTLAGRDVRERAERLEIEAQALERAVGGRDTRLSGSVRVTCAETIAAHLLAPCFPALLFKHPKIMVDLMPDPEELSLAMRRAELSVRLTRPKLHDLVVRRMGDMSFGLYASPDYLKQHGLPDYQIGCSGHSIVAQTNNAENAPQFKWLADLAPCGRTAFQTSSHEAAVNATVNGAGLACLARFRADKENGLIHLAPPHLAPTAGVWLVVHKDNRNTSRIRVVMTHIAECVRRSRDQLMPDGALTTALSETSPFGSLSRQ